METKKFRKRELRKQKLRAESIEDLQSLPSQRVKSPKTMIGMNDSKPKKNEGKTGLIAMMKAAAEKKELESKTPRIDIEASAAIKLASTPNLPKSIPPVFVTEASKHEIKLPAIREENSQDDIKLKGDTGKTTGTESSTHKPAKQEVDGTDQLIIDPSPRTKKTKSLNGKDKQSPSIPNGHGSPRGQHNTHLDADSNLQAKVPSLPDIDHTDVESVASEDGRQNGGWDTALKFVNQRIQNRLTTVSKPYYTGIDSGDL